MPRAMLLGLLLVLAGLQSASSQGANKKFDGRWTGESIKCFPATGQYRFTGVTVTNGEFNVTMNTAGRSATCTFKVGPDGSFKNPGCAFEFAGTFNGDKLALKWKTSENFCDVTGKRSA